MLKKGQPALNSLEEKISQLIICRLDGEQIGSRGYQEEIFELISEGIGGFILFGGEKDEVKPFIRSMQTRSEIPLFIASDIERGVGQQVSGTTLLPCQMAMAAALDKERPEEVALLRKAVEALSDEARDIGINMPLIPVLDINQNPDNPIICTRAFSDNPEAVAWFGSEYIRILERSGLISCAKHFPGHGDTSADSHISLPVIKKSYGDLLHIDIVPFRQAIKTGVSSIMVGHLSFPAIDAQPSSMSSSIINGILRGELGFEGLVMTDALNMNALKDMDQVSVKCLKAGIDILLHPSDVDFTLREIVSAVRKKELEEQLIDDVTVRILNVKQKITLGEKQVRYAEHEELSARISERSMTMIKDTEGVLPLSRNNKNQLIFSGDSKHFSSSPLKKYFEHIAHVHDTENLEGKRAVIAIFTSVAAWAGSSGIDEDEKDRIKALIGKAKDSVVISFGSPYVLRHFQEAGVLIAAYEPTVKAQEAALKCLNGEIACKGRLPVKLYPGDY